MSIPFNSLSISSFLTSKLTIYSKFLYNSKSFLLNNCGYIVETLALGEKKFMGICKLTGSNESISIHRRIDILVTPESEYPFALMYFTGPVQFNVAMRTHALERGVSLNEHGFTPIKKGIEIPEIKSELDIFNFLEMKPIIPTERI